MTMSEPIGVVVTDDHPVYRDGLVRAISERPDLRVAGEAADGAQTIERMREPGSDLVVLDVRLPDMNGPEVFRAARDEGIMTPVVFLSALEEPALIFDMIAEGAAGFISKDADREDICDAIVAAAGGETVLSPELRTSFVRELHVRRNQPPCAITGREREVLELTAAGLSAPRIATRLGIQPATVKTYLERISVKLGVSGRAAMVAVAMRRGLLD
jgi:two-component system, NarL family, nitrate/nitrite response regulator NarL